MLTDIVVALSSGIYCREANFTRPKSECGSQGDGGCSVRCPQRIFYSLPAGCADDSARYRMIVSPRAGPTLTMDNFAPVNSEMYLRYFLAAEGSCENFRAPRGDAFQPRTSLYTG